MKFLLGVWAALALAPIAHAADDDDHPASTTNSIPGGDFRYGLFGALDHRSVYSKDAFPEPFIVDDMALEDTEFQFNWGHTQGRGRRADMGSVEFQKGLGLLTVEAQLPFQHMVTPKSRVEGLGPLELGARYPLLQYVSPGQNFDNTFGVGLQSQIPLQLRVTPDTELEPQVFSCLSLGQRFTAQTVLGYSVTFGPDDNSGERSYDMGISMAYAITHQELPLPGVQLFYPMVELSDELGLNKDEQGHHNFQGAAGFRAKFVPVGEMNSSFGVAYIFPLDEIARKELHWGIMVSVILDF